ncbi:MAG: TMAO reductase system periplasmic protein TorT [SAR324 cluster bacterium]|nr:TMAO reductase system periplasmic protein TorT [SAR324 cluster bacterium]
MNEQMKQRGLLLLTGLLMLAGFSHIHAADWYPLQVDIWDPPFNNDLKRRSDTYTPVEKANRPWKICVSIPHLKDAFWTTVNFALFDEAKRLGVRLRIKEAGGYDKLDIQLEQIQSCMDTGADGLIVGGITSDGLNVLVEGYLAQKKPVIDLINSISAKGITARAAGTYWENGNQAGKYLKKVTSGNPAKVLWFPGPKGPAWSKASDQGFRKALLESDIEIMETGWGDTGHAKQAALIEAALSRHPDVNYVVGTAVSAEAAVHVLRKRGLAKKIKVMSYYYSPGVHRGIRRGHIMASPTDKQGLQARLAMDIIVRALEGKPYLKHVGSKVEIVNQQNLRNFDETSSIPPRGFRPVFSVDDWVAN